LRNASQSHVLDVWKLEWTKTGFTGGWAGERSIEIDLELMGTMRIGADTGNRPLRDKPVSEITTEDVRAVLRPIWQRIPETANRVRGRIENVLDAAKVQGLRSGENPAAWRGHLKLVLAPRQKLIRGHHAAMPIDDLPEFMTQLRARPAIAARCLEFAILTAARSNEALGARWDEIDLRTKVWTIPAFNPQTGRRMKAGREHRVPLADRVMEILDEMKPLMVGDHVFPGRRQNQPLSSTALEMMLRRMNRRDVTVHGFRSTFRDWAGNRTSYPRELAEHALAHTIGDKAEQAYRRDDARASPAHDGGLGGFLLPQSQQQRCPTPWFRDSRRPQKSHWI
jgi:integrase